MLTIGSLFAGIGGIELGLERTGYFKTVWQVENEPACIKRLEKNWSEVPRYGDVRGLSGLRDTKSNTVSQKREIQKGEITNSGGSDIDVANPKSRESGEQNNQQRREDTGSGSQKVPYADLICGGFPCQDISNAGKRVGIEGKRSGLWSEMARLVGEIRPRYVLVENVSALLTRGIDRVLGDLATLGYDAEWDCIPASAIGANHQRDRVFIVAYRARELAYPISIRDRTQMGHEKDRGRSEENPSPEPFSSSSEVPNTNQGGLSKTWTEQQTARITGGSPQLPDTVFGGLEKTIQQLKCKNLGKGGAWERDPAENPSTQSFMGRVAHGVPCRVDRLKCLGNAVVPQVAEAIGYMIKEFDLRSMKKPNI